MSHIFLSYSATDRDRVEPLIALLGRVAPVWWDQRIMHGDSWDEAIQKALDEASCVVVVWTEQSTEATWVKAEARYALKYRILVPVRLDPVDIPLEFSGVEAALLEGWDGSPSHPEAEMLTTSVAAVIGRGRNPAPIRRAAVPVAAPATSPIPIGPGTARSAGGDVGRAVKRGPLRSILLAIAVLAAIVIVVLVYPKPDNDPDGRSPVDTAGPSESRPFTVPAFQVKEIIVSETGYPTLAMSRRILESDSVLKRGYHYLVDVDGSVHSYFHESRRARHTSGANAASLGIGLVHQTGAASYRDPQIDSLVSLLTVLAHDHLLDTGAILSKGERDLTRPKDITARMPEIRRRVGALLGEWRVSGVRPAAVRPPEDTVGTQPKEGT